MKNIIILSAVLSISTAFSSHALAVGPDHENPINRIVGYNKKGKEGGLLEKILGGVDSLGAVRTTMTGEITEPPSIIN